MTKIAQKNKTTNVQLHIDQAYEKIKNSLPRNYVQLTLEKLKDPSIGRGTVRNVKNRINKYPTSRLKVLNALVELANEYKMDMDVLAKNIKQ